MDLRNVVIVTFTPVKDDAGLSGKVIGSIYGNFQPYPCVVDYAKLHDKDVPIIDPPTWMNTGKQGWIEWSHCVEGSGSHDKVQILTTYYFDGRVESKIVG